MKKVLFLFAISFILCSCGADKWEYKIVSVDAEKADKFFPREIKISNGDLNLFGKEGWELVDTYTDVETVHPNFGNEEYVSGLQPNVRTSKITFIFKRKI